MNRATLRVTTIIHAQTAVPATAMPARVLLRAVEARDLPTLFEHQLDPDAQRMAAFPARERRAFDAHWAKILQDPAATVRTIVADGEVAGYISSWQHGGIREVGYWIGRPFWGRGVATAALSTFLAIDRTRPMHAHVAVLNVGSVRVLEKCGFTRLKTEPGSPGPGIEVVDEHLYRLDGRP